MAPDDRTFEKSLARHLRSASEESHAQRPECADAETLAAYHERLLAPAELSSWKDHIVGCSRCQEILAQLEATDEIPLGASSNIVAMQPEHVASASIADSPSSPGAAVPSAASVLPRRVSRATWRWAVPAGALAAGLLIWIVSRESHLEDSILHPASKVQVAENRRVDVAPQGAPPSEAAAPPAQAQTPARSTPSDDLRLNTPAAMVGGRVAPQQAQREAQRDLDQAASPKLRKALPLPERAQQQDAYRTRSGPIPLTPSLQQTPSLADAADQVLDRKEQDLEGKAANQKLDKPAGVAGGVINAVPSPAASPAAPALGAYDRRDGVKKERPESKDKAPFVTAQNETVSVSSEASAMLDANAVSLVASGGPRILPVPGTQIIWKIDDDGRVRRSADLGATWLLQDVGVNSALLSGAAPSEKVCWLVGTFGTVLLTTDGGAHWTRRALPVSAPADRIAAFDAQHAIVTLRASTTQFETFDAGQTWSLVKKK